MIIVKVPLFLLATGFFLLDGFSVSFWRVKWTPLAFACITLALWVV